MWTLTRLELFKIFKKPRTYIAFAAIALIIGLIQLAMKADGESYLDFMLQNLNTAFDIEGKKLNGYFVFYLILHTLLVHVPLLICLVAGDAVAGEAAMGTLRLLVTKPVSRTQLLLSKFFASSIYTLGLLTFMAVMGLLGSVLIFGTSDLMVQKSDQFILLNKNDVLWRYVAAYGFAALSMITVAAVAFLFSVFSDNSIGPIVAAMSVVIVMTILTTMDVPVFNLLKPYLFTNHMLNWKGFFDNPVDYPEVLKSALVLLGHIVLFVSLALYFFRKKTSYPNAFRMKIITAVVLLLLATVSYAQTDEAVLQKVKAKLDKVTDYEATGKLKLDVSFINAQESDVTIYFKKPNKFKVKKAGGISILPKGGVSVNTASLLPTGGYQTLPGGKATVDGVATTLVKIVPTDEASDVAISTLYIDEKEAVIRKAVVKMNNNSNSYEVQMTYGKYTAWGLPDKVVFSFNTNDYKLPKGITFEYDKGGTKVEDKNKTKKGSVTITYANYKVNKGVSEKVFE